MGSFANNSCTPNKSATSPPVSPREILQKHSPRDRLQAQQQRDSLQQLHFQQVKKNKQHNKKKSKSKQRRKYKNHHNHKKNRNHHHHHHHGSRNGYHKSSENISNSSANSSSSTSSPQLNGGGGGGLDAALQRRVSIVSPRRYTYSSLPSVPSALFAVDNASSNMNNNHRHHQQKPPDIDIFSCIREGQDYELLKQALHIDHQSSRRARKRIGKLLREKQGRQGFRPIHEWAYVRQPSREDEEALRVMLEAHIHSKTRLDLTDNRGRNVFHLCAQEDNKWVLERLLQQRGKATFDMDAADRKGNTALHVVAKRGNKRCGLLLLLHNAVVDPENHAGKTPLELAERSKREEMVQLLGQGGAFAARNYRKKNAEKVSSLAANELDRFGWAIVEMDSSEYLQEPERSKKQIKRDKKLAVAWRKILASEKDSSAGVRSRSQLKKIQKLARKGVPNEMRGKVWPFLVRANQHRKSAEVAYQRQSRGSKHIKQIDLDIHRTHRKHVLFRQRYGLKQRQLFRILRAYSIVDPELGYTQGMASVCANILCHVEDEELAFWTFYSMMRFYTLDELYRPTFPGLQEAFYVHGQLLEKLLPKLHQHLIDNTIMASAYSTKWFLTIFSNLPYYVQVRVWDFVLAEGYVETVFCVALAILKLFQKELLQQDFEEIMLNITKLETHHVDPDKIIKTSIKLRRKVKVNNYAFIRRLQKEHRRKVVESQPIDDTDSDDSEDPLNDYRN